MKPKDSRRKEITKIRAKVNKIETTETLHKSNENKNWFFKKINRVDEHVARITQKKREDTNKVRNERGDVTPDRTEIQRVMRHYYKQVYTNKLDDL